MAAVQKRKIRWAISLFLVMLYFSALPAQAQYGGGSGEPNEPYLIYTAEQMNTIGAELNDWDKHFKLMADIDLADYIGTNFNIIGNQVLPFTGVFDGNGHTISNFSYTSTDVNSIALFGCVYGKNAVIKDLGLINPNVDAGTGSGVGSLVDLLIRGNITGCYVEGGSVSGNEWVGGLVGYNSGTITNCYSTSSVSGNEYVGGLVGWNFKGSITTSYSTGTVSGNLYVDGLVGLNSNGTITNCYSSGDVINYSYGGGGGTEENPYLIYTAEELNNIGLIPYDQDKHFKLMADIDLAAYTGTDFNIIGYYASYRDNKSFTGVFDGNGKKISNFNYTSTDRKRVGIFGYVEGGTIKDLGLIDPNVDAGTGDYVGSLVGNLQGGTVTNCYVDGGSVSGRYAVGGLVGALDWGGTITNCYSVGSVTGGPDVGGLVGYNFGAIITNCSSTGSVSGQGGCVGGLVGWNEWESTITNCYSTGSVTGNEKVGGLVGGNRGIITNCYSTGSVSGREIVDGPSESIGGLSGSNSGTIANCYATGGVTGQDKVGGLVGLNGSSVSYAGTIANCYSVGSVTGTTDVGGLVGLNDGDTVTDSFWDTQTSRQATSACGAGLTTAEMQMESTFIVWGGDNVWTIDEGIDYPRLWWENKPGKLITKPSPLFGGGSGTKNDPFLIYTAEQLNTIGSVRGEWDKHFKLMADIDLSDFYDTDFNIIGNQVFPFTGVFDGNGKKIFNFSYTSTDRNYIGLFGYVSEANAQIKDLGLIDPNIDAGRRSYVGSLVGELWNGTVTGCYVKGGRVTGRLCVGGLVGYNSGTIVNCTSSASILYGGGIGGLVGWNSGRIIECHSSGEVSGHGQIGGLVGQNSGIITNCYSSASVSGDWYFGGLVGALNKGIIANCYSTGSVSAKRGFGSSGGLVGEKEYGAVYDSFWDIQTSGQTTSYGGTGLTTAEMQMASTFIDSGWDFVAESVNGTEDIWSICEGTNYPRLVWQIPAGDFVCPDGITIDDFVFFIEYWRDDNCDLSNDYCDGTDLDFSGTVDEADLEILIENWLAGGND